LNRRYALKAEGVTVAGVAERVAQVLGMTPEQVWQPGKFKRQVIARSLLCFWAVHELGVSMTPLASNWAFRPRR
jgi:hypothetical protein